MANDKGKATTTKLEKDHAKTGRPLSPADDPTIHAVGGDKDAQDAKDRERLEDDNSLAGKLRKSELFFINDHSTGRQYVGISPQNNPKASEGSKSNSSVTALDAIGPRTGMIVVPKDGDAFTIADGFGLDTTFEDWAKVMKPDGSPLF